MSSRLVLSIVVMIFVIGIIGCSGSSPTTVSMNSNNPGSMTNSLDGPIGVGVDGYFNDGTPASGMGALGLFSLLIDTQNITAEINSLRKASLTDVLEVVDITNFLSLAPCTDCVKIKSVAMDADEHLVLTIGIKHPFEPGDPLKPITGRNRADLHVFNVEGIIISNMSGTSYPGLGQTLADFTLANADGYTSYLDTVLEEILPTNATIHPYILHFDDYSAGNFDAGNPMGFASVTDPPPSGNLVMPMGSYFDYKDYVFANLPATPVEFILAVGCTYAVSANNKAMRFNPEYRVPQHCKKAASEVRVEIVTNDLNDNDPLSSAQLAIKVLDINHGVAVGSNLDQMLADSSVGKISIEIPGVTASPVVETSFTPTGNGRDPNDPLTFLMTVTNSALGAEGSYQGLVKVTDAYAPGQNTSPLLSGSDGIKRVDPLINPLEGLFQIHEFATYAIFSIDVATAQFPQACFTFNPNNARVEIDGTVNFDGTCSYDPSGGTIVQWEWDWEMEASNFSADETTTIPTISHEFTSGDDFLVGLRVTNNAPTPKVSEIFSDTVTMHGWRLPPVQLTSDDVLYSDLWWGADTRMGTTSDGLVHIICESTYTGYATRVDYFICDADGLISTEVIYTGSTSDIGLVVTDTDEIYAFVMMGGNIVYRKKNTSGWDPQVTCMAGRPGYFLDHAGYAVNSDGDILVMMSEYGGCPTPADISYSVNEGSGFSPKTVITTVERWTVCNGTGGSGYGVTVFAHADSTGTFYLAWDGLIAFGNSNRDIWYSYYDGTMSSVGTIASGPQQEFFPIFRTDGSNNLWCAYRDTSLGNCVSIKPNTSTVFGAGFSIDPVPAHNFSYDINPTTGVVFYITTQRDAAINNEYHNWSKFFNVTDNQSQILSALKWRIDESVVTRSWWPHVTYGKDGHWYAIWDDQRELPAAQSLGELFYAVYW